MPQASLESRFTGAMLGTFIGDALGAPFEGAPSETVVEHWDRLAISMEHGPLPYTDDTQMMVGVAESLAEYGGFNGEDMARCFAENYEPHRGYGASAHQVLAALQQGYPWDQAATLVFPEGSFGNGAAMRVAPVGVFYYHDLAELRHVAELSASITHGHPLGKEGAALQACAVALAVQTAPGGLDPGEFLRSMRSFVRADLDEYILRFAAIERFLDSTPTVDEVIAALGNDVRAHAAVPAAIYAFLSHPDSFKEAVVYAVKLGGDTDTIGAMAGAIAGGCHGVEAIPRDWLDALENESKGRDYVLHLAARLYRRHLKLRS